MRFSRVSTDDGIGFSGQALRGTCQRSGKSRSPRREAPKPAMVRSVWSQLGEHGAQFGA